MCKISIFLVQTFLFFVTNAIVCRDGFTLVNNKCLMLFPINEGGKSSSQLKCNSLGGNLVSIHTAIDNTAIAKLANAQGISQPIWIGLQCVGSNDPSYCIWEDQQTTARYNNFQAGNPQRSLGINVGMIPSTGKWVTIDDSDRNMSAVCETDMIGECTHKFGEYCYSIIAGTQMEHYSALNVCEQQICGSSLASIHSADENSFIFGLFIDQRLIATISEIHIGALLSQNGTNYWSDGTIWDFQNFDNSSGRVYGMSKYDGKWRSGDTYRSTVCKWKASTNCRKNCTGPIYREETGQILSPNFYGVSYNFYRTIPPCYYILHVPNGLAVIWFIHLSLDSSSSIELYSGIETEKPFAVITKDNQLESVPLTSSSDVIKFVFNQCQNNCDMNGYYYWLAEFGTNYGASCGNWYNTTGVITSQNYPETYPNNYNCTYYFQAPTTFVDIKFNHFETEQNHDFVKIFDQESGELLMSLSGTKNGFGYTATGPMRIEFTTDGSNTFSGWSAIFRYYLWE
ncbi:unnamed protein product [Caenorhabditis angaria]|uniref:CUB domain-containing protein n=1 Tax=Caenorhabditis angaria TaxID=860376 RepID=A0A9P1IVE5_9PELO|nr:unnamed protein product [Caenorhabditis angaria]